MVFYRKYRPQTISQLDSAQVRETLTAVLSKGTAHAYLFTGPKGLGKTSTARIVAKVVNCEKNQGGKGKKTDIEPCNTCEQCVSITNGNNLDIIEIDAASNRGIDEMRELKDKIRLAPLRAKKKVYIIDEVHMLTTEAFNALLKTLEEPPEHVLFILCTTEQHKVPSTILSRCFHIGFRSATEDELVRSFRRIVEGEKLTADDDVLRSVARLADGGFRDGAKVLEELAALAKDGVITKELVEEKYHSSSLTSQIEELISLLIKKDTKAALALIIAISRQGIDMKYVMEQLLSQLHQLLLAKAGLSETGAQSTLLEKIGLQELKFLLHRAMDAYSDMKYAVLPQLPLELLVIEWGEATVHQEQQVAQEPAVETPVLVKTVEETTTTGKKDAYTVKKTEVTVSTLKKQVGNIAKIKALYGEPKVVEQKPTVNTASVELLKYSVDGELTKEWIDTFWSCIISEMKSYNHTLAGLLRGCVLKSFDRKNLVIETAYKFHKERLDQAQTLEALHQICKALTGTPISVSIILKSN